MNYETATDFEINKAVAEALGFLPVDRDTYVDKFKSRFPNSVWYLQKDKDYRQHRDWCLYPSAAWPIIVDNKISMEFVKDKHDGKEYWMAYAPMIPDSSPLTWSSENPLRAAMIVFLKMKESK